MKLENWALTAEVVGGIAIVLSLIFVGIEVRQSREAQIQTGTQAVVSEYNATVRILATESDLACIYARGAQDFSDLSALQQVRLSAYLLSVNNAAQQVFGLMLDGSIDSGFWNGFDAQMKETAHLPGLSQWWEMREHWYGPEFRAYRAQISSLSPNTQPVVYDVAECSAE